MSALKVQLFGKFCVRRGEQVLEGLDGCKVQELFSYLLLNRSRPHPRETLAGLLWGDSPTGQSKKYLRQALWRLQAVLDSRDAPVDARLVQVGADWVQVNPEAELWLDVGQFEEAFTPVEGVSGQVLGAQQARSLQGALQLYRGDLLEGCYQDWCLCERERLQDMYLAILDKLMSYCEAHQQCEAGLVYGDRILRHDRARERTHRRMMRLQYLAGDRTAALRQYERCVAALDQELGVTPSKQTVALYEEIRADRLDRPTPAPAEAPPPPSATPPLADIRGQLAQLQATLADFQRQVQQDIHALERALNGWR